VRRVIGPLSLLSLSMEVQGRGSQGGVDLNQKILDGPRRAAQGQAGAGLVKLPWFENRPLTPRLGLEW
jgi:hypothetical protein